MDFSNILKDYPPYGGIVKNLNNTPISVAGVVESALGQLIYSLCRENASSGIVVTYSDMEARALYSDLELYTDKVLYFPSKEYVFYNIETTGHQNEHSRLAVLDRLMSEKDCIVVTSVDAILQYTAKREEFINRVITFEVGKRFDLSRLTEILIEMGYSREDMVEGKGQFAVRGGIVDIFSPNYENPIRLEFFDDEVDSVRSFDSYTQRTLDKLDFARIIPVVEAILSKEKRSEIVSALEDEVRRAKRRKNDETEFIAALNADIESFNERGYFPSIDKYISMIYGDIPTVLDYFDKDDIVFVIDPKRIADRGKTFEWEKGEIVTELKEKGILGKQKSNDRKFFLTYSEAIGKMTRKKVISIDVLSHTRTDFLYKHLESFTTKTTISFHG
ncbi:MAG: hypothetical protein LIO59_05365, partial [Oscillospiraceae bacterium]|nr:hypothetical protein [Oscillospiraceae bacterium]